MIKLYQFPPAFGVPNPSPFCMKLEAYLNLTELDYEIVELGDPRSAPKGKGPFLEIDGVRIGDSALIIEELKIRRSVDPNESLTPEQRSIARAIGHMLEEHLYFAMLNNRWFDDRNWPLIRETFFGSMPAPIRGVVSGMIRRQVRKTALAQGMGRHNADEINAFGMADIDALADYLGDKPCLMGANPTTVDCIAIGFVANLISTPFVGALNERVKTHDNLVRYHARMMARLFPNWSGDTAKAA